MARMSARGLVASLAVAVTLVMAAPAGAVVDAITVAGTIAMSAAPSVAAPANTGLEWVMHATSNPPGNQPDTASAFTLFLPQPFILNAQDFPTCGQAAIDGAYTIPPECLNAEIGAGSATMYAGTPGGPLANSVREELTVRLLNAAPAGSGVLLVVSSRPAAPVTIVNRVIPGTMNALAPYAFGVTFTVPADLRNQLGLSIALTDLDVTVSGTPRPITVGANTVNMSYLQLPGCSDGQLSARQLTDFGAASLASDSALPCAIGAFADPPDLPLSPYTSPRLPVPPTSKPPLPLNPPSTTPTITVRSPAAAIPALGRLKPTKAGILALPGLRATCPSGLTAPCMVSGTASWHRTRVATVAFPLASGAHADVRMRLTSAGRKLLRSKRSVPAVAAIKVATATGVNATQKVKFTLVRR